MPKATRRCGCWSQPGRTAAAGAKVVVGDLDDLASLRAACAGARAVFSATSGVGDHRKVEGWTEGGLGSIGPSSWSPQTTSARPPQQRSNDPAAFNGVTLQLAGDVLTLPQIVEILSRLDGKEYVVLSGTVEEAVAAGLHPGVARGLTFMNFRPVLARPENARSYGLSPMSFETWARKQRGMA